MLAISNTDYRTYGCPNCGCDTAIRTSSYMTNEVPFTCENCHLKFTVFADGLKKSSSISLKNNQADYPVLIEHPRRKVGPKWKYEWPDPKPASGEFFSPRGIGYDLAGFVKSRQAGERIVEMARRVLGKDKIKSWLDYRPYEPKWIQVKFQKEEFDLELLNDKTKDDGIITEEILRECVVR